MKRYTWLLLVLILCLLLFDSFQRNSKVSEVSEKLSYEYSLNYHSSGYRPLFDLEIILDAPPDYNDTLRTMLDDNYERQIVIENLKEESLLIVYTKKGIGVLDGKISISSSFSSHKTQLIIRSLPNTFLMTSIFLSYFLFLLYLYIKKRNRSK